MIMAGNEKGESVVINSFLKSTANVEMYQNREAKRKEEEKHNAAGRAHKTYRID
jgi:hypothetical protein